MKTLKLKTEITFEIEINENEPDFTTNDYLKAISENLYTTFSETVESEIYPKIKLNPIYHITTSENNS